MSNRSVETAAMLWPSRPAPASALVEAARALQGSGVVDDFLITDQQAHLIPPYLWTTENTPMAGELPDLHSFDDAFATAAYTAAAVPGASMTISTDSIRRGPAELMQTMLTLAKFTEGRVRFHIGAGEAKQNTPFGHKRSQGVKRMQDLFRIADLMWDAAGPIDFEGHYWNLKKASIGASRPYRPQLWGLGGGPELRDYATSYCDGLAVATPCVWTTPDQAAEEIAALKLDLERKGRDPEKFGFGIYGSVLCHDDEAVMDRLLDNPLVRWWGAIFGRIQPTDWLKEGIEPPVPNGWTYFANMLPHDTTPAFVEDVIGRTSRTMMQKGFHYGTPEQVGEQMAAYARAGVTWVLPCDWTPALFPLADAPEAIRRSIEICAKVKKDSPLGTTV